MVIGCPKRYSRRMKKKNLFLGGEVYRWKGRLNNAPIPFDAKHPIWLPTNSPLVDLLIKQAHDKVMHNGQRETLNELRSQFQIPRLRQRVRHFIYKCTICKKHGGKAYRYPESYDLPKSRLQVGAAFQNIGIDYCGPYLVYNVFDKTNEKFKVWISLITCQASRAVYLDIATDYSGESCIEVLRRFMNRRGIPEEIFSDKGSTFTAENKNLSPRIIYYTVNVSDVTQIQQTTTVTVLSCQKKTRSKQLNTFGKRWKTEYLLELRETHKKLARKNSSEMINENDIVLINEENVKRNDWRKGRVSKLLRGRDGKVRGAELVVVNKYGNGILRRPINKLFPFEYHHSRVSDDKNNQEVKIKFIDERDLPSCVGV
ncbi:uncharacterized protein [Clytia hemisphaerica]|uniref:uncharacterized protein n=1 Tax=Clytia hemisphaerica TaxID=252671 RepID=UPI0034D555FF